MEKLKSSKYNFLLDADDGTHLLFNAISCGFAKLDDANYLEVQKLLADPNNYSTDTPEKAKLLESAKQARYIMDEDINELEILKLRSNVARFRTDSLHLTIMPTLKCNFRCTYCYENPNQGKMSKEIQDGLIRWVKEKTKTLKSINIAWFGGEPLLGFDVIKRITHGIKKDCEKHKVHFSAGITTNAYLMDEEVIREFKNLAISSVQVSIDGPPEIHNKKRVLANSKGTYDTIIDNLMILVKLMKNIEIVIRVNCDSLTYQYVPKLFDVLPEKIKQKSVIYFRQVFPPPPPEWGGKKIENDQTAEGNSRINLPELFTQAQKRGFITYLTNFTPMVAYCEADYYNHFVVDPAGNLHKCTVGFSPEKRIGYITPKGQAIMDVPNLAKWMSKDPFSKDGCKECGILPLCLGGCDFSHLCSRGKSKKCSSVMDPAWLEENLRMLYRNFCLKNEREQLRKTKKSAAQKQAQSA